MDDKNIPLATGVIRTLKRIIILLIIAELLTIGGFLWYISLPVEDITETSQTVEDIESSKINQVVDGDINGESDTKENNIYSGTQS